jgi:hypothetical protein
LGFWGCGRGYLVSFYLFFQAGAFRENAFMFVLDMGVQCWITEIGLGTVISKKCYLGTATNEISLASA